ncbi:MAG: Na+/H+ antiporter subunit E [Desulfuromonas sp.]
MRHSATPRSLRHALFLILLLGLFWLLLSGHTDPLMLAFGALSVLLTLYIALRMAVVDEESLPFHLPARLLLYWLWLAVEVAKSTWDVTLRIWRLRPDISPTVIHIEASQKTPLGLMLYANSITLTPGTLCMDVSGNQLLVHALSRAAADDLLAGTMDRRVRALEPTDEQC